MKQFTKYICAFLMLAGMSVNAWGTTENISFATCEWGFPAGTTGFGYFSYDGYKIYAEDVKVGYLSPNYYGVMLEKNTSAHILLPSIPGTISSIVVTAYSGASTSANLSLYVDGVIVGSAKNIGNTSASWTGLSIPANAVVKLQNDDDSGGKVTQITGVTITHNGSQVGGTSSSIPDGNYEIEAMPAVYGQGTATSNVAYSEAYETVTFTATPASGYTFDYWEITYVSSCTNSDLGVYSWIDESTDATCRIYMPAGKVTATAYFEESDCTTQGVIVSDKSDEDSQIGYYGTLTSFDVTYMSDGSGAVTWSSTNTDVATVVGNGGNGATVTVVGAGSANIVATVAEDATYCEGEGVYELLIEPIAPTVTNFTASCTNNAITITNENSSTVSNKGGLAITRYGYLYSTSVSTPTFGASGVNDANVGTSDVTLNARWVEKNITGLSAGTTYYVRAYAYNGEEYGYSTVVTITTKCAVTYVGNGGTGTTIDASSPYDKLSDVSVMANSFVAPDGKIFDHWAGSDSKNYDPGDEISDITADITLTAQWRTVSFTDAKFSCADWTLTGPSGDIVFITSAASKTVRSQEAFHVSGSGLPHETALTFTTFPVNTKFEFKKADGTIPQTNEFGVVDADVYAFYTPDAGDTSDGLDELTSLTVSVTGEPRTATIDTKRIIGRHLPADFVIAAKNTTTNKWYALPANMSGTGNPEPVEIAVDDINNPTIAYTAASNVYNLYLSADKEKVQLGMKNNVNGSSKSYALWANNEASSTDIGKNTGLAENTLGDNYKWTLTQTNTSITNPQDAKYTISNLNNVNPLKSWFAAAGGPKWGLYAYGVEELRLIPASNVVPTEAYFVEWAQHGGVVEVDAQGIAATSVVAHLNGESSSAITLVQTKAGDAKNKSSKYNYTVNFGGSIDFAAAASNGALLTLEWKNGETVKAMSNIVVPKIVASNITINKANYPLKSDWNTEVHVLPGKTVTVDPSAYDGSNVTIKELNIYPGATVVASTGTLIATTLVLRNGWSRAGEKTYDVARLYVTPSTSTLKATNVYADWYIDYDQYYPIAVPWKVTTSGITYLNTSNAARGGVKMRYYDGEGRANGTNGSAADGANWLEYSRVVEGKTYNYPETLNPGKGYAMTARRPTGKAFSIVRLPLTLPSGTWGEGSWTTNGEAGTIGAAPSDVHKDTVYVHAWGVDDESKPRYAVGWNFIANPYMSIYQGPITHSEGSSYNVEFVTIPDTEFKEYDQYPVGVAAGKGEKLLPASGFFIQTAKDGTLTFGTGNRQAAAPSFRNEVQNLTNKQKAYIVLNDEENEDMMGLLVSDLYTADYDINGDLEKLMGEANSLKTYMRYNEMNMAYVAINEELAREWIPITVRIPENGEYTYSLHEASIADELEGVYLIDYQNGNVITNLLDNSYTFYSSSGIISGRFAINAIVGMHDTPTDVDIINAGGDIHSDKPVKFIYRDKVYILNRGVIYDSTGKKVREINK